MKKFIIIYLVCLFVISLTATTWVREYTYQASEADSKITSRAIALEQVKRLLLEELGVYVYSTLQSEEIEISGEVKELTAKQIEIISAGITESKIIEETWNGEIYYIKAEITADENDVIKRLDAIIADKEKTKQLEESHQRTEDALTEIETLKQQLAQTRDENEKLKLQNKYNQSSNQLTAEDWFQKGVIAHELNELDNALLYYQKSLKLHAHPATFYNIGLVYATKGNFDKALEFYIKTVEIYDDYFEAYNNMGIIYTDRGDYDKATECYQKAIEINPEFTEAYYNMGIAYYEKGNYERAIESYQKAIGINPDYADAYYNKGNAYYEKGNYDRAIECYQKAIEINPDYAVAYYNEGMVYHYKGNYDRAIECYGKAIAIKSNYADAYYNMGIAYAILGNSDMSIRCNQQAARLGQKQSQDLLKEFGISW